MSNAQTKLVDSLTGEILSSERLGQFMGLGGGLGGGSVYIPDDPSVVWNQILWNHQFAMYVYRDMELKDDMVSSALETRKEAVLSDARFVQPASNKRQDKKAAEFIEETLEGYMGGGDGLRFGFNNFLWEALDAVGKGVAIGENVYDQTNDRVFIKSVNFKPQMLFNFAEGSLAAYQNFGLPQTGPLRLRADLGFVFDGVDPEQPLPEGKFFVHTFRPYQGDRWGSPQDLRAYWITWFKKAGWKQSLRFLERGPGTVVAKYQGGAGSDEQNKALQAAQAAAEEASLAISKGTEIEVLENVRGNMGSAHSEFLDRCDNGIARIFLGQTLTSKGSEGGGSRALGEVHERVAARKKEADALSLMLAVNTQLVWPLTLANIGVVEKPPIWMIRYQPGADLELMSKLLYRAWQQKIPYTKAFYYETMQIPAPAEGEDVVEPPTESEQTGAIPGGESASFGEPEVGGQESEVSKKKRPSTDRRVKPPTSNRERFAALRPSTIESSQS